MSYGIYTKHKMRKRNWFGIVLFLHRNVVLFGMYLGVLGVLCTINCHSNFVFGFCVIFCTYDHVLKICLNIVFKHVPEV